MTVAIYQALINLLSLIGFFDIFLPFILVYAVIYGLLNNTKIFGEPNDPKTRQINSLIAFSFAGITIGSMNVTRTMKEFIPLVILFLLVVFTFVLAMAVFYLNSKEGFSLGPTARKLLAIISAAAFFVMVAYIFKIFDFIKNVFGGSSTSASGGSSIFNSDYIMALLVFIGMILFAYWLTKPATEKS